MTDQLERLNITQRDLTSKTGRLKWAKRCKREAVFADSLFQTMASESFKFEAGDQWDDRVKAQMKSDGREPFTFNLIKPNCDLIMGIKEQNEVDSRATPTEINDEFLCEIVNKLHDKDRAMRNVQAIESEAFRSAVVCGRGFLAIDVQLDPKNPTEIEIVENVIPYDQLRLDPATRKDDLSDCSYLIWEKWLSKETFATAYQKEKKDKFDKLVAHGDMDADHMGDDDGGEIPQVNSTDSDYDDEQESSDVDVYKDRVRINHMEYKVDYDRYYGFFPQEAKTDEFLKENLKEFQARIPNFEWFTVKDTKIKWLQWSGNEVLMDDDSPLPFDEFSPTGCFTYRRTLPNGRILHFGLVEAAKDPQREFNKRWSQTTNLIMKQGQGGKIAEITAPVDKQQFEDSMNDPGAITWVKDGALGKVQDKAIPSLPSGPFTMMEKAGDVMKQILGINPDLMGDSTTGQQVGVVVRLRQQQGLSILAPLYTAYRAFKKQCAQKRIAVILAYMPDSQIAKIIGQDDKIQIQDGVIVDREKGFQANLKDVKNVRYNIDMVESPANMTRSMFYLSSFMEMAKAGIPVPPDLVIDKMDLPVTDKKKWNEYIQMQQQQAMQLKQMEMQMEMGKIQQDGQLEAAKLQQSARDSEMKGSIEIMKMDREDQKFAVELVQDVMAQLASRRQMEQQAQEGQGEPKRVAQGGGNA